MQLALTVLEITAPVFLLAGIGFGWVKFGFDYPIEFVTRLAQNLSVPALIFVALMQADIDKSALANLTLAALVAYSVVGLASAGIVLLLRLDRRTYLAPLVFGNTGNLGLPLALFAFGETGLSLAVIVFALTAIGTFTFGIWCVAGAGSGGKVLREPMVWATLLGALFLWQGWETPTFMTNTLSLLGQMAIPLMLVTLGVAVARLTPRHVGQAIALSLLKLVVCTAIAWAVGRLFALDNMAFGVLVLQMATPVAVTSYLLAEKYQADSASVAGFVVISTVLSVGALPLLLAVLL